MGVIGQIKRRVLLLALVVGLTLVTACGNAASDTGQKQHAVETEADSKSKGKADKKDGKDKSDKAAEAIPGELLPGGAGAEEAQQATASRQSDEDEVFDASEGNANSDYATGGKSSSDAGNTGNGTSGNGTSSNGGSGNGTTGGGNSNSGTTEEKTTLTVDFEVESSQAESYGYSVYYSKTLTLEKGATVYDALAAADVGAVGSGSYIQGIGGLYEKDCGSMSGWKYYVNGTAPSKGCADYTLNDGDSVQWTYALKP